MAELEPTRIIEINTLERIFCDFHPYGRGHGIPKTIGNATRLWETITNNAIEPNTRALDERVKELAEFFDKTMEPFVWRSAFRKKMQELFPAELKEKLKESEDG